MADDKDKFVHSELARARAPARRRKTSFVSDGYTKSEALNAIGTHLLSWEAELGRRLEIIAAKLGRDVSVQLTGRSWKQLQRYFEGHEVPAGIVASMAAAAGASTDYVLEGNITTSGDSSVERRIVDRRLVFVREAISMSSDKSDIDDLRDKELRLLSHSGHLAKIGTLLLNRPRRLKTLEEYANPAKADAGNVDPAALHVLLREQDLLKYVEGAAGPVSAGGIDRDLLASIHKGVSEVYRTESAKISADPLADEVARIYDDLVVAYDSAEERLVGLKGMLQQLRRELRSPPVAGAANSKRVS